MSAICEKFTYVQSLERMMDRLGAADLTVSESSEIQPRLLRLLDEIERSRTLHGEHAYCRPGSRSGTM